MNDMFSQERIFQLLLALPAFIAAFTVHEFAHAWMANRLGDDTPRRLGRLTLDPIAHLDPMGSIMFVFTQLVGFGIGWAKPVPFNPRNFDRPRRDMMLVAVAGPLSNILQVPFWFGALFLYRVIATRAGVMDFAFDIPAYSVHHIVVNILSMGIIVNIVLAAFNMIPFPPLDGHYVLEGLGPPFVAEFFNAIRGQGFLILLLLSYTGILSHFIAPAAGFAMRLVFLAMTGYFF
jgi:Zn-dependent protease